MPRGLDLRDDLDFAIEALETARESIKGDRHGAEKMAINMLAAKRQIKRIEAQGLVVRATKFLDG